MQLTSNSHNSNSSINNMNPSSTTSTETPTKRPRPAPEVSPSPSASSSAAARKSKSGKAQKKSSSLPAQTVEYLKAWMMSPEHVAHPYPTEQEKAKIMADTGITLKQLTNWFVNNRKRYWKPRVEARLQQQAAAAAQAHAAAAAVVATSSTQAASQPSPPQPQTSPNPISPTMAFKPTVSPSPAASAYVSFDLCAPTAQPAQAPEVSRFVPFSLTQAQANAASAMHAISEASSSVASVSASESDCLSSSTYDELETDQAEREPEQATATSQHPSPIMDALIIPDKIETDVIRMFAQRPAKRARISQIQTPRHKYRRVSVELWRDACHTARDVHDDVLPTLEEAAQLFGYAS